MADLKVDNDAAVAAALAAWEALTSEAQTLLAAEKALLDSLKARIGELKPSLVITFTATTNGTANTETTTAIVLAFSAPVSGLGVADISLGKTGDTGSATKGILTGSGSAWTLAVTVAAAGSMTLSINKPGIEGGEKTVAAHKKPAEAVKAPPRPRTPQVEVSGGKLLASWDPAARAETYDLYYRDATEGDSQPGTPQITGIVGETTELGLDLGKAWYVWIRAVNDGGESPVSARALGGLGSAPDAVFSSLAGLKSWLSRLPQNTALSAYVVKLKDMNLGGYQNPLPGSPAGDGIKPLYESFGGRYLSLDLDACTGATIGWGSYHVQNSETRPDKDKLVSVILPATSTSTQTPGKLSVGRRNFEDCVNLREVELPENLVSIGEKGFSGCANLKTIVCRAVTPPSVASDAFSGLPGDLVIKVPAVAEATYRAHPRWGVYTITALEEE
jgi:hypothetical protein